jgi:hypothetical protein
MRYKDAQQDQKDKCDIPFSITNYFSFTVTYSATSQSREKCPEAREAEIEKCPRLGGGALKS